VIRRRLGSYLWWQRQNGQNRFNELRGRGVPKFSAAVAAGSPTDFWSNVRTFGRSNRPCATTISTHSVSSESMSLSQLNPVEPPWYATRMPGGVRGCHREVCPYPDQSIFKLHAQSSLSCYRKACLDSNFGVPMINRLTVRRIAMSAPIILLTLASLAHQGVGQSAPSSYPDQPQCVVKSVQEISTPLLGFF
jgi:hypothetical protein